TPGMGRDAGGFPREPDPMGPTVPDPQPQAETYKHHLPNADSSKAEDGGLTLVSKKHSIRLDKSTTYVLELRKPISKQKSQ
ncbi:MAG TPA: hypothetical protein VGF06_00760, partial [Terriglobales bacterium]